MHFRRYNVLLKTRFVLVKLQFISGLMHIFSNHYIDFIYFLILKIFIIPNLIMKPTLILVLSFGYIFFTFCFIKHKNS